VSNKVIQWPDCTTDIADLLLLSGGQRLDDLVQELISRLHALGPEIVLKCSIGLIRNAFEGGLMRLGATAGLVVLARSIWAPTYSIWQAPMLEIRVLIRSMRAGLSIMMCDCEILILADWKITDDSGISISFSSSL
jgi:hypothetical protein